MKATLLISIVLIALIGCKSQVVESDFSPLIPPKNMLGWDIRNGNAEYTILENEIIGTTKINTKNTFLCTKQHYYDFILEFDVLVDSTINSGVQIRSNSFKDYYDGAVHGYQVEIDPSKRAWSGGIYDESRRGWIYDLKENEAGRKAFRNGEYNQYRIEVIGDHFTVWVNEVNTVNLIDSVTDSGFIGFQVHSIGDEKDAGKEIRWKNIRIATENLDQHTWADKITATLKDLTAVKED